MNPLCGQACFYRGQTISYALRRTRQVQFHAHYHLVVELHPFTGYFSQFTLSIPKDAEVGFGGCSCSTLTRVR